MPPWTPSPSAEAILKATTDLVATDTQWAATLATAVASLQTLYNEIEASEAGKIEPLRELLNAAWKAEKDKTRPPRPPTYGHAGVPSTKEEREAWKKWRTEHNVYLKAIGNAKKALYYKKLTADDVVKEIKDQSRAIDKLIRKRVRIIKRAGTVTRLYHNPKRHYFQKNTTWYFTIPPSEILRHAPTRFP